MKQEQVIELARKAGISVVKTQSGDDWMLDLMSRFASMVEQETLERASKHVETYLVELCAGDKDMQNHYLRSKSTREFYAGAIRNLAKESQ